jgi:putative restriction endonuclease
MRAYVGVTDGDWYQLLRDFDHVEEVNFWQPGGKHQFRALEPGELFLFKLHSPRNFIVGGGIFAYSTILPVSLAWESFSLGNGAPSFEAMRRRIERYRRAKATPFVDYDIGCILLTQPFFLPESEWIPTPADWAPNIVQGKRYDLENEPGASLFRQLQHSLSRANTRVGSAMQTGDADVERSGRYGAPTLITPRLGQGTFRVVVTDAYERRCAITGEKVLPVLQAAHIRPYAQNGPHHVQNGLLLRSDLHTLFDRGYLTVGPDRQLEVSQRLHEDFDNGREYYALRGRPLRAPRSLDSRPHEEFLAWHNENVYRG